MTLDRLCWFVSFFYGKTMNGSTNSQNFSHFLIVYDKKRRAYSDWPDSFPFLHHVWFSSARTRPNPAKNHWKHEHSEGTSWSINFWIGRSQLGRSWTIQRHCLRNATSLELQQRENFHWKMIRGIDQSSKIGKYWSWLSTTLTVIQIVVGH